MITKHYMARVIIGLFTLISVETTFGSAPRKLTVAEEQAISSEPRSLLNRGNTCFMNSAIQMISALQPLNREVFLMKSMYNVGSPARDYIDLLELPAQEESLKPKLCRQSPFEPGEQEDSYQYLLWLLDQLSDLSIEAKHKKTMTKYPGTPQFRSALTDLYFSEYLSVISHNQVEIARKNEWVGPLDLPIQGSSLQECLKKYLEPELDIEYMVNDRLLTDVTKQMTFTSLPEFIFMHLKRGEGVQVAPGEFEELRNETPISFPLENFAIPKQSGSDLYDLVGFVTHGGGAGGGGHYKAFTKHKNNWYECNDDRICTSAGVNAAVQKIAKTGQDENFLPTIFVYQRKALTAEEAMRAALLLRAKKEIEESKASREKALQRRLEEARAKADKEHSERMLKEAQKKEEEFAKKQEAEEARKAAQTKKDAELAAAMQEEEIRKAELVRAAEAERKAKAEQIRAEAAAKEAQREKDEELARALQAEEARKAAQEERDAEFAKALAAEQKRKAEQARAEDAERKAKAEHTAREAKLAEEARKADVERMAREERERVAEDKAAREAKRAAEAETATHEEYLRSARERLETLEAEDRRARAQAEEARRAEVERMAHEEYLRSARERLERLEAQEKEAKRAAREAQAKRDAQIAKELQETEARKAERSTQAPKQPRRGVPGIQPGKAALFQTK